MAIERGTEREPVSALMSRSVFEVTPRTTVGEAIELAKHARAEHLLVFDGEQLAGVVCRCDLDRARRDVHVGELVRKPVIVAEATTSKEEAAELMRTHGVGCLPLFAGGLLLGVVTRTDMLRAGVAREELGGPCRGCGSLHALEPESDAGDGTFCRECLECAASEIGGGD